MVCIPGILLNALKELPTGGGAPTRKDQSADMLSARKVISLIRGFISSQLIELITSSPITPSFLAAQDVVVCIPGILLNALKELPTEGGVQGVGRSV